MCRILLVLLLLSGLIAGCSPPHAHWAVTPSASPSPNLASSPTPTPTPSQTPSPSPTPANYDYTLLGCVYASSTSLHAAADPDSASTQILWQGQTLFLASPENGFYPARCGETAGFVAQADVVCLGNQLEGSNGLLNVRLHDESFLCYMLFAQEHNFCGYPVYDADVCMLEPITFGKLQKAQQRFMEDGYCIKINDAYRPQAVQHILFDLIQDRVYIADPSSGSRHNRGLAVDMTLVDLSTGQELEMPSPVHTFGGAGRRDYDGHSAEAKKNMNYMTKIMEDCGFASIQSEWWHFMDISAEENFPVLDIPMSLFTLAS